MTTSLNIAELSSIKHIVNNPRHAAVNPFAAYGTSHAAVYAISWACIQLLATALQNGPVKITVLQHTAPMLERSPR